MIAVKLEGGRAKAAAVYPDELCREMCRGLKDQIAYNGRVLKCLGEKLRKDVQKLVEEMPDAAREFIEEDNVIENLGSHGDSPPPTTDEGRRAEVISEHASRQSSKPKPISQAEKRVSWACHKRKIRNFTFY